MPQPLSASPNSSTRSSRTIAAKPNFGLGASPTKSSLITNNVNIMSGTSAVTNSNGAGFGVGAGAGAGAGAVADASSSRAQFSFQFSAATEMILKRLRGEGGPLNPSAALGLSAGTGAGVVQPPGYEDVRRSVLQGMKTTLNMDLPTSAHNSTRKVTKTTSARISTPTGADASASTASGSGGVGNMAKGKAASKAGKAKAGTKRKRAKDDSDSAEDSTAMSGLGGDSDSEGTGSVTRLPTKTLSGRKVVKPAQFDPAALEGPSRKRGPYNYKRMGRSNEQALCKRCGRGHSPASNMIVFCDGCNIGWHQMCHDPMVSDDLVKDESKEWFCRDCAAKRPQIVSSAQEATKNPGWPSKSIEERRAYLATFAQSHLVSLLLHATSMHPDIPIYPPSLSSTQVTQQQQLSTQQQNPSRAADRRLNVYPQQPFPPSAAVGLFARAEANPNAPINFIRKITPGGSASPSSQFTTSYDHNQKPDNAASNMFQHSSSAPPPLPQAQAIQLAQDEDAEGEQESRESTPASPPYPRPGNGLMAKLPPDDQDLEWLVGEGEDEAAFSHMVFDPEGGVHKVDERTGMTTKI